MYHHGSLRAEDVLDDEVTVLVRAAGILGVTPADLQELIRTADQQVLRDPRAACAVLTSPAISDHLAAHLVAEVWFLEYAYLRHEKGGRVLTFRELAYDEQLIVEALRPFPLACLLLEVLRAFPSTLPDDARAALPDLAALDVRAAEVLVSLVAEDAARDPDPCIASRTPLQLRELARLAEACVV